MPICGSSFAPREMVRQLMKTLAQAAVRLNQLALHQRPLHGFQIFGQHVADVRVQRRSDNILLEAAAVLIAIHDDARLPPADLVPLQVAE